MPPTPTPPGNRSRKCARSCSPTRSSKPTKLRSHEVRLMSKQIGVVQFPGTNCELDVVWAVEQLGGNAEMLWHGDETTKGVDAIVVPGGFAHGDYLRTGAIARFSPV